MCIYSVGSSAVGDHIAGQPLIIPQPGELENNQGKTFDFVAVARALASAQTVNGLILHIALRLMNRALVADRLLV